MKVSAQVLRVKKRVCVVGAGCAGLLAVRHLKDVCEVVCFETKSHIGGLWNTKSKTPPYFKETHNFELEGIYENLKTNLPWFLMNFKDFCSKDYLKTYPSNFAKNEYENYLNDYANHF